MLKQDVGRDGGAQEPAIELVPPREAASSRRANPRRRVAPVGRVAPVERPELRWPGKATDVVEAVAHVPELVVEQPGVSDNVLIIAENGAALRALGRSSRADLLAESLVKLAYLDPPYNTGNRFDHYDDAMHSAHWLDDLRERLLSLKKIMHTDGSIWLHLDDSEQHHGRCLMDEVFGREAFVATVIWQRRTSRDNRTAFSISHDYIHVYAPAGPKRWKQVRNGLADNGAFANPDNDPRGPWRSVPLSAQAGHATASQFYTITTPRGLALEPPPGRCWTYTASRFQELVEEGRVYWPKGGLGRPRLKRFEGEVTGLAPSTLWLADEVGDNAAAKKELLRSVGGDRPFDTPKPESLMERIIHVATDPGDLVLDPYLGSGTTALVAARMSRRWVGVEEQEFTVRNIAVPRLEAGGAGGFALVVAGS